MALLYFLVCFILSSSRVAAQSTRYELRGQKVSLKPDIPEPPDSILWKQNGNKVVEFNGNVQEVYGQYENRVSLDWHTAELNITDLTFEDSGHYELEVYVNKQFSTSLLKLKVIDRVAKPNITCEMNDGGSSNKSGTLLCSADTRQPQSLMTFEWLSNGKVQPGIKLTISLGDEYDDKVYSCRVSNLLSNETATFTAKDCYPENDDSVLIGVLVAIAILVILVGLGIFCCKQHQKACFAKGNTHDPEKQKLPGETKDENTADERRGLIDRTPTIPSKQPLNKLNDYSINQMEGTDADPDIVKGSVRIKISQFDSSFHGETLPITFPAGSKRNKSKRPPLDLNHFANNTKDVADEDQLRESAETEVPQSENTPEPAVELTNTISSTAAEQSDLKKNKDENEETGSPPSTPRSESHSPLDPSNPASNDKGDADADQLSEPAETVVPHCDSSDSEEENKQKPADVSTNSMSDLEPSTVPEHQDLEEEKERKSPSANDVTPPKPPPKPRLHSAQNSPNTAPEVTAAGQKENANSGQDNGETDTSEHDEDLQEQRPPRGIVRNRVSRIELGTRGQTQPITFPADLKKSKDENEETGSPLDPSNPASNDKGDRDAGQLSENEPKPADVSTNTMSDLEPSTVPEHQDLEEEKERKSPSANVVTPPKPPPKPRLQSAQNSPNTAPEVTAAGQKEDANSGQGNGETDTSGVGDANESGSSGENKLFSPVSEQKDSETAQHDQDPNLTQSETHESEDNQEIDKPDPEAEKESDSEGNSEEPDLYSASSHQSQRSTPTTPDNGSNTFQEPPDAAHDEPGQQGEGKTTRESDECSESEDDTSEDKK